MSFKLSTLIIENPLKEENDKAILNALGWRQFSFVEETTFEAGMFPRDGSISIGYYNNAIVICEDLQFSRSFCTNDYSTKEEKALSILFPDKEILSLNCHGTNNAHGYSLTKNAKKLRYKFIMHGFPKCEGGEEMQEEVLIYQEAISNENNIYKWKFDNLPNSEFLEDQLMEEFTFKVGKRLLGVEIGTSEDEDLMHNTIFKKYKKEISPSFKEEQVSSITDDKEISSDKFQNQKNKNHSRIISVSDDSIILEEFSTLRWQSEMFNKGMKTNIKTKKPGFVITLVFMTVMILGATSLVAFILKMIGLPMGNIYWSTVFVFLSFMYYRLYKITQGEDTSDYYSNKVINNAKKQNQDIDKLVGRIVRFQSDLIQWETADNEVIDFPYSNIINAQMNHEVLILTNKDNLLNTIKLIGLTKEEKFQIKKWMKRKSKENKLFEWVDLT